MIKSILVGLNGTQFSKSAVEQAIRLAAEFDAKLLGLAVLDHAQVCPPESVPIGAGEFKRARDAAMLQAANDQRERLLLEFEQQCQAAGVVAQTQKIDGDPAQVLCAQAQRVDLLVVGKKHTAAEESDTSAATLQAILHQSPRPVLCVPRVINERKPILIAYDGSLPAARAVQLFIASGLDTDRPVHLLTIGDRAAEIAEPCLEFLAAHGIRAEQHLAAGTQPAEHILKFAERLDVGMLVMGAYGQPRFREFFFGSTTQSVLQRMMVPLYLYH